MNVIPFDYNCKEHYIALETIDRTIFPDDFETEAEQRHAIETNAKYRRQLTLLEDEGQIIGHAQFIEQYWSSEPDAWYVWTAVHTDHQGRGGGKLLYDQMMGALEEYNPATLLTNVREDYARPIRFLADRDYMLKLRELSSALDVTHFDEQPFSQAGQNVTDAGVRLYSLTELAERDPDWEQKTWAMRWLIRQDIPSVGEKKQIPFEQWRERHLNAPNIDRNGYIVAVDADGNYIGLSFVYTGEGTPHKLWTGMTGVVREWRRKGVATALKLRVIDFAKQYGATEIETDNEENNPMYNLNEQLGFRPRPAWLTYQKVVRQT